jgi:hypothetical protein
MQDLGYNIGVLKVEVKEIRKRFRVGRLWRQLTAVSSKSEGRTEDRYLFGGAV